MDPLTGLPPATTDQTGFQNTTLPQPGMAGGQGDQGDWGRTVNPVGYPTNPSTVLQQAILNHVLQLMQGQGQQPQQPGQPISPFPMATQLGGQRSPIPGTPQRTPMPTQPGQRLQARQIGGIPEETIGKGAPPGYTGPQDPDSFYLGWQDWINTSVPKADQAYARQKLMQASGKR